MEVRNKLQDSREKKKNIPGVTARGHFTSEADKLGENIINLREQWSKSEKTKMWHVLENVSK